VTISNTGSFTITATETSATANGTSNSFTVDPGAPTQLAFTVEPTNEASTTSISPEIKVQVQDALGNLVSAATDSITLAINNNPGSGTLSGTLTVAAVSGEATFSDISIDKVGVGYTLDATAGGLSTATSASFDITVGVATQLVYSVQPTNTVAKATMSPAIKVQVQDAGGNLVTSATDSITLAINNNPSGGTLSGTLVVAAVSGEATFSDLSIDNTGTGYTLDATGGGLPTATSVSFDMIVGAPSQLVLSAEPTNAVSTVVIAPAIKVQVEDAFGNFVPTATDNITLAINNNPGSGTLSGTLTLAAVSGEATFNDISIDKVGVGYTLDATAGGLTTATTASFNITLGSATKLGFSVEPVITPPGASITPAIKVQVQDAGGNLISAATDSITLAIGTNPSAGTLSGTLVQAAVSGEATFSDISIDNGGNGYTLTASAGGLTGATSASFNIALPDLQQVHYRWRHDSGGADWFDAAWGYRKKITIDNTKVDASLSNFPVYVNLADLGADFFTNVADVNGGDIRVTAADGVTELPRQIVAINTGGETGELHFKGTSLSDTQDTDFYIYYGNAGASEPAANATYGSENVWDSDYTAILHLGEGDSTAADFFKDSTSNANHGTLTDANSNSAAATGQVDGALDFNGDADRIAAPNSASLNPTTDKLTISLWMNPDTDTNNQNGGIAKGDDSNSPRYQLGIDMSADPIITDFRTNTSSGRVDINAGSISINEWTHLTGTYDGSNMRAYVNGVQVGSDAPQTGDLDSSTSVLMIGARLDLGRIFPGIIDEVRISDGNGPAAGPAGRC